VKLKLIKAFHWSIRYVIYGYPPANVTWFKDGSPLVQNDVIYDRVTSRGDAVIEGGLMFEMSSHLNNGNYTLIASNTYGTGSQTIYAMFLQSPGLHLSVFKRGKVSVAYVRTSVMGVASSVANDVTMRMTS